MHIGATEFLSLSLSLCREVAQRRRGCGDLSTPLQGEQEERERWRGGDLWCALDSLAAFLFKQSFATLRLIAKTVKERNRNMIS